MAHISIQVLVMTLSLTIHNNTWMEEYINNVYGAPYINNTWDGNYSNLNHS